MISEDWYLVGAPWDCSGTGRGEDAAPGALRVAGLTDLVGTDLGDASTRISDVTRDEGSGVLALPETVRAARALEASLDAASRELTGRRALVVGGDCSVLLGTVPALRRRVDRLGLVYLDGHPDYLDGHTSETGETADMPLAVVTGVGASPLTTLAGPPPMVSPADVVLLGHREAGLDEASAAELARVPPELRRIDARAVVRDPLGAADAAVAGLPGSGVWVHLDLDVVDPVALPAVTYPQAEGLGWEDLETVLRRVAAVPALLGVSIADFRPDLDPAGTCARRIVRLLGRALP